jgi:hypothetical protein
MIWIRVILIDSIPYWISLFSHFFRALVNGGFGAKFEPGKAGKENVNFKLKHPQNVQSEPHQRQDEDGRGSA